MRALALAVFICVPVTLNGADLPSWHKRPTKLGNEWSEKIGNPEYGITGQYYLNINLDESISSLDRSGLSFHVYGNIKFPGSYRKDRNEPWANLYLSRVRYRLDDNMVIDIEMHPAIGKSSFDKKWGHVAHRMWLPFYPDTLRVQAWLSNGAAMNGGLRIAKEMKPNVYIDARRQAALRKGDLSLFPSNAEKLPSDQAAIGFRNGDMMQHYEIACVSSTESGPFTGAELRLSPDVADPRQEPVYGKIAYSVPVYAIRASFDVSRPFTVNRSKEHNHGERTATVECVTNKNKVIRATRTVRFYSLHYGLKKGEDQGDSH